MAIPEIPKGVRKTLELPLPWEPDERLGLTVDYWMKNVRKWPRENDTQAINDYLDLIKNQYIITGGAVAAVEHAVTWHSDQWETIYQTVLDTPDTYGEAVVEAFEGEALGVETGKTWWEHPAGFGGGYYPIENVAALAGLTPDEYKKYIQQTGPHKYGHILIRSANYLAAVSTHDRPPAPTTGGTERLLVGEVTRLSKVGLVILESTLNAYAAGKKEALS